MVIDIDISNVRNYLLRKEDEQRVRKQKERDSVILKLEELDFIFEKYGIERVYLYGAFADMTFHKYSDIDIAIEPEIPFEHLLQIYSEIDRYFNREIDLRLLREIPFSEKVRGKGVIVYERKNSHTQK